MVWTLMNVKNPKNGLLTSHPLPNIGRVVISGNPTNGWTLVDWDGIRASTDAWLTRGARAATWLNAVCRYRRYRVYWAPRRITVFWPPGRTLRCRCWSAASRWARFERLAARLGRTAKAAGRRACPNSTERRDPRRAGQVDHVVHCAAIYDITAGEAEQRAANVEGTRAVVELARRLDATLHHVSSIAVAGDFPGEYTEDDFDVGQQLRRRTTRPSSKPRLLVRSTPGLRYRIYRPAVVVGDSRTGEMDKVDGPYYFFGVLSSWPCCRVHSADAARYRAYQHRSGRLRGRRGRRTHARRGPGRAGVSPDRAENRRAARHLPRGRRRRRVAPAARVATPLGGRAGAQGAAGGPRHCANMAATQLGFPPRFSTSSIWNPRSSLTRPRNALQGPGLRCRVRRLRAQAVAILGRASRPRSRAPRRSEGPTARPARHHHRRVQRDRPGVGGGGRRAGRDRVRAGPQRRRAGRAGRRDPRQRRSATPLPAMSPIPLRWSTPSKTSWAASAMSTTW